MRTRLQDCDLVHLWEIWTQNDHGSFHVCISSILYITSVCFLSRARNFRKSSQRFTREETEVQRSSLSRNQQAACKPMPVPPRPTHDCASSLKFWIYPLNTSFSGNSRRRCYLWRREDSDNCIACESGSTVQDLCAVGLWKGQKGWCHVLAVDVAGQVDFCLHSQ